MKPGILATAAVWTITIILTAPAGSVFRESVSLRVASLDASNLSPLSKDLNRAGRGNVSIP